MSMNRIRASMVRGETDNPGLGQVTVALSAILDVVENPQSADQPTTLAYALHSARRKAGWLTRV